MDEAVESQVPAHLQRLDQLIEEGGRLRAALAAEPDAQPNLHRLRRWQSQCAGAISQLSGGSKAHWLSRAYSQAFLVLPGEGGQVVVEATPGEITQRIVDVLSRARLSLSQLGQAVPAAVETAPRKTRFDFVHDAAIRDSLEQAHKESEAALQRADYPLALVGASSALEAIITDALEHRGPAALAEHGATEGHIAGWPFPTRIAVAEKAGLISAGCARLPAVARDYRRLLDASGELRADAAVTEREAKLAAQVLRVIIRDLSPGR